MENKMSAAGGSVFGGKTFCVIPAYNEAANIAMVISQVKPLVDQVVVVDDGSADRTYELAKASGAAALRHLINRGQGAALRTGTAYCLNQGAEIIVHFDADGQFLAQDIKKILAPLLTGDAAAVFGSRFLSEGGPAMPWLKKYLIMPLARAANKIFFNVDLTDPQSGFRALTAQAAETISWRQDRMAHCSEIMFAVKKNDLKTKEVPIQVVYRSFGLNLLDGFKILKDLFIALMSS